MMPWERLRSRLLDARNSRALATGTVLLLLATGLLAAVPASGNDASVPRQSFDAPCGETEQPAEMLGLTEPTADRWQFSLSGADGDVEGATSLPSPNANPRAFLNPGRIPGESYDLELESQRSLFLPADVFGFLGEEYSTLTGEMITEDGVHNVELLWVGDETNVYSPRAQAGYHMVLEGKITYEDGSQDPLELRLTFPGTPLVCEGSVQAFNYLHLCLRLEEHEDPCVPAGWEMNAIATYYHNGPVTYTGALDGEPTAGQGTGHGFATNWAFANVPF